MTELQKMYAEARVNGGGRGHHAALRLMSRKTGIDPASIDRALKRARRTDVLEAKRAAKAVTA